MNWGKKNSPKEEFAILDEKWTGQQAEKIE